MPQAAMIRCRATASRRQRCAVLRRRADAAGCRRAVFDAELSPMIDGA